MFRIRFRDLSEVTEQWCCYLLNCAAVGFFYCLATVRCDQSCVHHPHWETQLKPTSLKFSFCWILWQSAIYIRYTPDCASEQTLLINRWTLLAHSSTNCALIRKHFYRKMKNKRFHHNSYLQLPRPSQFLLSCRAHTHKISDQNGANFKASFPHLDNAFLFSFVNQFVPLGHVHSETSEWKILLKQHLSKHSPSIDFPTL